MFPDGPSEAGCLGTKVERVFLTAHVPAVVDIALDVINVATAKQFCRSPFEPFIVALRTSFLGSTGKPCNQLLEEALLPGIGGGNGGIYGCQILFI